MGRTILLPALCVGLALVLGCTPVQKGTATGGLIGGTTGAAIGHYGTSVGGAAGGAIGLGVGAAAGALAADHYYAPEESGVEGYSADEVEDLSAQLRAKEEALAASAEALEREKAQQKALMEAYEELRTQKAATPAVAAGGPRKLQAVTTQQGDVQIKREQDKVTYTITSSVLFDSGKADLSSSGKSALRQAARDIRQSYPNERIEVRGHTDNVPIRYSGYKSNWELSVARALAVLHHMVQKEGFDPSRLTPTGCADTQPVASNKTAAGRAKNRRAEIIVHLD